MQREQHEDNDENIKKKNETKKRHENDHQKQRIRLTLTSSYWQWYGIGLRDTFVDFNYRYRCVLCCAVDFDSFYSSGWLVLSADILCIIWFSFLFFFVLICFFIASFEDIATSTNPLDKWTTRYRYPFTRLRLHDGFHSLSRFLSFMFLLHISDLLDLRLDINRRCNRGTQHPVIQKWKRNKKKANTILSFSLYFFLYFLFHFIQFSFLFTKLLRAKYHHADPTRSFNFSFEFWITIRPLYSIWFQHACVMIRSNQMKMKTDETRNDISSLPPWW